MLTDFILVKYGMLLPRINSSNRGFEVDTVDPDQTAPHAAVWSWSADLLCYIVQVDIVDPDQTAPHEAVWSRSTDLLCYINLLHLFNVRYINYVNT